MKFGLCSWIRVAAWLTVGGVALVASSADPEGGSVGMVISRHGSARATTGANYNKIATRGDRSHVVWQDSTGEQYLNQVRTFDHASRTWSKMVTLKRGSHKQLTFPAIVVDHQGYLHALMHGHHLPITHRRSVRPNDASEWTDEQPVGEGLYPSVVSGVDGTLYVAVQSNESGNADLLTQTRAGIWERHDLVKRGGEPDATYATCLPGLAMGQDGTLHVVCNTSRGQGGVPWRYQTVGYMRSRDGGRTWEKADGTPLAAPAVPEQMDVISEGHPSARPVRPGKRTDFPDLAASGNLVVDSRGTPYVLYVSHLERAGQLILATTDSRGSWLRRPIVAAERLYPDMRPIGLSFPFTMTADDTLYVLLELVPFDGEWVKGRPERGMVLRSDPVKRLVLLTSVDRGRNFSVRNIISPGNTFHFANLERPTGGNTIFAGRVPPWIYFNGRPDYPKANETRSNNVFWVFRTD